MKQYDVTCPVCGTLNKGLFLEETDGWMECVHCHRKSQDPKFEEKQNASFPVIQMGRPLSRKERKILGV